jgi:Tfp pilus assembly protein PilP
MDGKTMRAGRLGSWLMVALAFLFCLAQAPGVRAQEAAKKPAAKASSSKAAPEREVKLRDPFRPLITAGGGGVEEAALPPGKRGLVIARLTVDGIVAMADGNIAVVSMRGRNRAYFLREGDEVYQGHVVRVTEDGVVFRETATDAYGGQYEREVVKQISGSGAMR